MKAWVPSWTSIVGAGVLAVCFATAVLVLQMDVLTAFALVVLSSLGAVVALLALAFMIAPSGEKASVLALFLYAVRDSIQSRR